MREPTAKDRLIVILKRHYYGNIMVLAALFLCILFQIIPASRDHSGIGVTLERYAILISIITIPLALRHFAERLRKAKKPMEEVQALSRYKNSSLLRLYLITLVTLMNIGLFYLSRNMNFLWITLVLFIIFLFCKPSIAELTGLEETGEEPLLRDEEQDNKTTDEETPGK